MTTSSGSQGNQNSNYKSGLSLVHSISVNILTKWTNGLNCGLGKCYTVIYFFPFSYPQLLQWLSQRCRLYDAAVIPTWCHTSTHTIYKTWTLNLSLWAIRQQAFHWVASCPGVLTSSFRLLAVCKYETGGRVWGLPAATWCDSYI